jgi:hypothetical protein
LGTKMLMYCKLEQYAAITQANSDEVRQLIVRMREMDDAIRRGNDALNAYLLTAN